MEKVTNWLKLWEQLSERQMAAFRRKKEHQEDDFWKNKARNFDGLAKKRWSKPDSSREFILSKLKENPGSTLLDIGAGTGAWCVFLSPHAKHITALEPSGAMAEIIREKIESEKIANIAIVNGNWPEIDLAPHDYILASHSMYGVADFRAFIEKMIKTARKACFLLLRVPFADSLMAEAALRVWGQPYDSPNFQVAYNALLQIGIYPNVLMETGEPWQPWENDSREEALTEIKNRLGLQDSTGHDAYLKGLLDTHLTEKEGKVVWPVGNHSALVYWSVSP